MIAIAIKTNQSVNSKIQSMDIDPEVVEHFIKENPELLLQVSATVTAYKQFLYLASVTKEKLRVPSDIVDKLWHSHILFTEDYEEYCHKNFGKFIHHKPYTKKTTVEHKRYQANQLYLASMKVFGSDIFDVSSENVSNDSLNHCDGHCGDCA